MSETRKERGILSVAERNKCLSINSKKRAKKSFKSRHCKEIPDIQTLSHTIIALHPCRNTSDRPPRAADQIPGAGWSVTACGETRLHLLQNHCGYLQGKGSEWAVIWNFVLQKTTNERRKPELEPILGGTPEEHPGAHPFDIRGVEYGCLLASEAPLILSSPAYGRLHQAQTIVIGLYC